MRFFCLLIRVRHTLFMHANDAFRVWAVITASAPSQHTVCILYHIKTAGTQSLQLAGERGGAPLKSQIFPSGVSGDQTRAIKWENIGLTRWTQIRLKVNVNVTLYDLHDSIVNSLLTNFNLKRWWYVSVAFTTCFSCPQVAKRGYPLHLPEFFHWLVSVRGALFFYLFSC